MFSRKKIWLGEWIIYCFPHFPVRNVGEYIRKREFYIFTALLFVSYCWLLLSQHACGAFSFFRFKEKREKIKSSSLAVYVWNTLVEFSHIHCLNIANIASSRCCWTTTTRIPKSWSFWQSLMGIGVLQQTEDAILDCCNVLYVWLPLKVVSEECSC